MPIILRCHLEQNVAESKDPLYPIEDSSLCSE